jgi:3-deoxy-D-manno-octulosonic-acid transferase
MTHTDDAGRRPRQDPPLLPWLAYNSLAVPLLVGGMFAARFVNEKAKSAAEGRHRLRARIDLHAERLRGCVWVHVSSAGEYEQARPLLRALRARPGTRVPTLLTVYSPSGHAHATQHQETDVVEYLPLDTVPAMEYLLGRLQPSAIVFVRYDCWPNLVWSARRRGIPVVLLGASLHDRSQRSRPFARRFFASVYRQLDAIGTIDETDSAQFRENFGVDPARLHVVGDSRVDQVVHRFERAAEAALPRTLAETGWRYLILGSVWPADENVVLGPSLDLLQHDARAGLVIAPHEPTPEHLLALEQKIGARGLTTARLSELVELRTGQRRQPPHDDDPARWRIVLVDTVGVLAEIYRAGAVAYVGGAFTTGVHSVLEPAVCGLPVLFGPRHVNSAAAAHLIARDAASVVNDAPSARRALLHHFGDESVRSARGRRAEGYVQEQSGATQRNLDLLFRIVEGPATRSQEFASGSST